MTPTPVGMRCPECSSQTTRVHTLRDEATAWRRAPLTMAIIAVNLVVYGLGLLIDAGSGEATLARGFGELQQRGALFGPLVAEGEWWRIVTSGFLHSSLWHVGLNMFLIYILGTQIEEALGRARYAAVYFGSMMAGALGAMLLTPASPTVGASGAGFGLMGAYAVLAWARGFDIWQSGIGGLILLNIVFTFAVPNISVGGHLGGLIGGALLGFLYAVLEDRRRVFGGSRTAAVAIGAAFTVGCFVATVLVARAEYPLLT
jgi:membrane associated rhomboid family serine protease